MPYTTTKSGWIHSYRIVVKEHGAPFILDEGQDEDDADDHAAGYEDDDNHATIHLDVSCTTV